MQEALRRLSEVHKLDLEIAKADRVLAALDGGARMKQEIKTLEAAAAELEAELRKMQLEQREQELALKTAESKRNDVKLKLYGGRITNSKELEVLEREMEALSGKIAGFEERILELMDTLEPLKANLEKHRQAVRKREERVAKVVSEQKSERAKLMRARRSLAAERATAAAEVSASLLGRYEEIRLKRGAGASVIEGTICSACGMAVPEVSMRQARESTLPALCQTCGRILLLPAGS